MGQRFIFASLLGISFLTGAISLAAEVRVGGGGAACSRFFTLAVDSLQVETGIAMTVVPSTPGLGLIELNFGIVDVATAAVPLEDMLKGATMNGLSIDPSPFTVTEIGTNKTLVFTHRGNSVKTLSKKQLKDIFTGKITNWKEVGGANLDIVVTWGITTQGQNDLFIKQILDGNNITLKHKSVTDYKMIKAFIEKTPGAIGINPEGFVNHRTNNPEIPLIISPVIAVTKGKPSPEADKLIQFVKEYAKK